MHHNFLDRYSYLKSPIHHLHPFVKLAGFVVLLVIIITAGIFRPLEFALLAALLLLLITMAKLPLGFFVEKTLLLVPLFIFLLVMLPFLKGERIIWRGSFILPLILTREGVNLVCSVGIKAVLVLWSSVLLLSTTRFNDLLYVLGTLGVPKLMITILAFMYRYVFLLIDEAERVATARQARLFSRQSLPLFFKTLDYVIRAIFLRTFERSLRIYQAMCARGFTGEIHLLHKPQLAAVDLLMLILFLAAVGGIKLAVLLA